MQRKKGIKVYKCWIRRYKSEKSWNLSEGKRDKVVWGLGKNKIKNGMQRNTECMYVEEVLKICVSDMFFEFALLQ